ncbi:fp25k [Antheraea pernyi nucleopolyhedrovirus]|uniref:25k FP n=2 Tax=Antheraea pernyi nuclear polyhedrosis virus TaxID=161494 RepID=Q1HH07_NPVAP|nr:fp25k [Antheraea pernyi nucleopolyhedrovirus]AWD33609.1 fusion protein-like [Antheraea proylei nucleopolyhedrovirus]BBD50547.1 fusion protein-like [Antheraea yamamai nucleopolyhedrovirus]BBD50699.1 fusion protein-like [Samia cynthia nucleopolyhedrovirus]ABF50326.1 fp25k [Antheraea pernyi nucleopolyhedrovirus]ABQ12318.1 fusion protein-like [Antheraea pernyi nucleopolyhedrovirus]
MDRFEQLINVSLLKSLINSQIDESDDIRLMNAKLKQLERDRLNDSVEIYGIHDARLASKRVRTQYLKKICALLDVEFRHVLDSSFYKNHIVAQLSDATRAREWQSKSREQRLKNHSLGIDFDGPVKIFVAAPPEQKLLLKKARDALLPLYKYISICKHGVMVRRDEKSRVFIVKNEQHIEYLKANNPCLFDVDKKVGALELDSMLQNII